jgi:hypothetical protein
VKVDLDLDEHDWLPRSPESPRGRLRMQVVSVQQTAPSSEPACVWVDGWRYVSDHDPAPIPARELVRFATLPPDLRTNIRPPDEKEA